MAFGWSVSDLASALKFLIDAAQALDDAEGAGKEFRQATGFLGALDHSLQSLSRLKVLDTKLAYKTQIETEVAAIKNPVERFIKDVEAMAVSLGEPSQGRLSRFKNMKKKWEWHYFTRDKAAALEKDIGRHLSILDNVMQQTLLHLVGDLPRAVREDGTSVIDEALTVHLARLQPNIRETVADLLEDYLGPGSAFAAQLQSNSQLQPPVAVSTSTNTYTAAMLHQSTSHLRQRFSSSSEDTSMHRSTIDGVPASRDIVYQLQNWWGSPHSDVIWLQTSQARNHMLTHDIIAVARNAGLPLLVYFCERFGPNRLETSQADILIDLVYALIYQLLERIDKDFSSSLDFTQQRFQLLDGTVASIPEGLLLLQDLLSLQSRKQLIVLDGMHLLDGSHDDRVETSITKLLEILTPTPSSRSMSCIIKTLITTDEPSWILSSSVDPQMILDASETGGIQDLLTVSDFEDVGDVVLLGR